MSSFAIWQNSLEFTCTWDLGRRCNLDCSYCPPHRHNSWSPHANFEFLKKTARLPIEYGKVLQSLSSQPVSRQISFTGGEPTLNPDFLRLCQHIKSVDPKVRVGVTSNGLFRKDYLLKLSQIIDYVTVSYHFEASSKTRKQITKNIIDLHRASKDKTKNISNLNVNVMVHAHEELFLECKKLVKVLDKNRIPYSLRPIGEHPNDQGAHRYSLEQRNFIKGIKNKKIPFLSKILKKNHGSSKSQTKPEKKQKFSGRGCCGGRSFSEFSCQPGQKETDVYDQLEGKKKPVKFLENRNFKGWHCLINLFFLHIHQEDGEVFHHQTCQANSRGERGPIGHLEDIDSLLSSIGSIAQTKKIAPIVCPNTVCNCGLCITKAKNKPVLQKFLDENLNGLEVI